ncbi:MAG: HAD family hydrolase [Lachnospiraceae bacterium]|nr:HAD family hydrolase [Lachnospiraceae bacterium]
MGYKKVFVSDFDGTLYFQGQEEEFHEEDFKAIADFQAKGYLFGICTGRMFDVVKTIIGEKIRLDFAITSSGAAVVRGDGEIISRDGIDRNVAEDIMDEYERKGFQSRLHMSKEDRMINDVTFHTETAEAAAELADDINQKYSEFVAAFQNRTAVNVVPLGCSKGLAVRKVQKYFDVEKTYAIGDSATDFRLFRGADMTFMVPGAAPELAQRADYTKATVAEALKIAEEDV